MDHALHERTLLVSLYTADEESKSDFQIYLRDYKSPHVLFLKVVLDETAAAPARVFALETLCREIRSSAASTEWHGKALGIVDKLVTDKNPEIAAAAAKYANCADTLAAALEHASPEVRKVAARRLRQINSK